MENLTKLSNQAVQSNPWRKYQFLTKHSDLYREPEALAQILQQFEMTLNVLADETLLVCSLLKPLSVQILEFLPQTHEFEAVREIIIKGIHEHIQENYFLIMATFFDPRFQSSLTFDDKEFVRKEVSPDMAKEEVTIKVENSKPERRSGLKMFLNRGKPDDDQQESKSKIRKTFSIDELSRYNEETPLDVDFCPLDWWKENSVKYKQLATLAQKYFCVPCFVSSDVNLKINDFLEIDEKKFNLKEKYFKDIWFINSNRSK